ncbi:hypothetical protein ACQKNX_08255 [Lysinibacillus sp. NPDC093712]|uniref:hypothetical protein n=1 Tax=Lysinibacillus sp. NPDC093712 TaxID=3390579 RepID=UPI003D084BE2
MATKSPIELLIALGVADNKSKSNITSYLDNLKKDLKLDVEINASKGKSNGFESMRKEIESLQNQVKELNNQLANVSVSKSTPVNLSQGVKREVVESMNAIDQLSKHVKSKNGEISFTSVKDDTTGLERLSEVVTRVKSGLNQIQTVKLQPLYSGNDIVGFKQISEHLSDISSKDLTRNIKKGIDELNKFARQGELSTNQYEKFRISINSSMDNTQLNKVLESMRSINKEVSHDNKMQNSMQNINKQAIELSSKLNQFTKDKNNAFDPNVVDKFLNRLDKLAGSNFNTVKGMKSANSDFSNIEKEINTYIKLQDKYKETIRYLELLQRQGTITSSAFANFEKDAKLATTTAELSRLNKSINDFSKTTKVDNQITNAFKNIGTEVERLNFKLKNVTNSFNISSNNSILSRIKTDIDSISNMKINSPKDIEKLNKLISETGKNISQLGQEGNNLKQFETKTREINNLLQKMKDSGLLTTQEMNKFANSLSRIESGNLAHINNLLTQMGTKFDQISSKQKNVDTFEKQQNSLVRLNSELTRTEKLFPRSIDKNKVTEIRAEIERLSKLNILNPTALRNNQKDIDTLKEKVKQFGAESTQAGRNSTGVLDAFKIAMERFPIWIN